MCLFIYVSSHGVGFRDWSGGDPAEIRAGNKRVCPIDLTPKGYGRISLHCHKRWHLQDRRDWAAAFRRGLAEGSVVGNPDCREEGRSGDDGEVGTVPSVETHKP